MWILWLHEIDDRSVFYDGATFVWYSFNVVQLYVIPNIVLHEERFL